MSSAVTQEHSSTAIKQNTDPDISLEWNLQTVKAYYLHESIIQKKKINLSGHRVGLNCISNKISITN